TMTRQARQQWIDFELRLGLAADQPWQRYLLYRQNEPVASIAVYFGSNTAGLYHVVTLPPARGQGLGVTLVRHALQQAIARNYAQSVLLATPMGINLYRRFGFAPCSVIHAYYFA
ncbi:MAG: GNAT family N-acetyltransferase, partial [Caldilineaceae bacterium]|nr:GNAT family N-acetyltransferase [Caldilineaceae bacterium]